MLLMLLVAEESSIKARKDEALDEGLFARMANGETAALETLYAQAKTQVYGFALSILGNTQDAQDVMQDTFITLYQKADAYRPQGKPMAFVLTVARNLALMKLRRNGKEVPLADDVPAPQGFEGRSLERMILQAALSILADDERQVIMLHCVAGLKHREIAELLGLKLGTTLSKYRRALSKLQKHLEEAAI